MDSSRNTIDTRDVASRKPYSKPQMQIYGNLQEITNTLGDKTGGDGGTPNNNATRLP